MHLSFKTRLVVWHAIWVTLILVVAAFLSDWALSRLVREQVDEALATLAHREIAAIEQAPDEPLRVHEMRPGTAPPSFDRFDKFVQITSLEGQAIARSTTLGTAALPLSSKASEPMGHGASVYETVEDFGEEPIRMISVPFSLGTARYAVQVAASLDDARAVLHAARWLFLSIAIAILSAVVATGAWLARRALLPIDGIVARARRIGESNLTERLPYSGTQDEIGRLVATLNDMLARIDQSFQIQRHFTADASHELMSPLTRLRAELEVTLRRPRDAAEYEDTLRSCLEEAERLSSLTEELLDLARLDAGEGRDRAVDPVSLTTILDQAMRRLEDEARRKHLTMVLEACSEIAVHASPGVVSVALGNVLDNAVKFCDDGGRITVTTSTEEGEAVVAVSDTGPGLLPEELPLIFERFHRGQAARVTESVGAGLGLAIVRALLERQGGRISVTSRAGQGSTFSIRLPLAPQPADAPRRRRSRGGGASPTGGLPE